MRTEVEEIIFSTDEEHHQTISECCGNCCSSIKNLPGYAKERVLERYIAFMALIVSTVLLGSSITFLGAVATVYSASAVVCSAICFLCDRGYFAYVNIKFDASPEEQQLLGQSSRRNRRGVDQFVEEETTQTALETLMEPRSGNKDVLAARSPYQVPYDFHYCEPSNYDSSSESKLIYGENSAGPSSAPDPFPPLNYDDDTCDSSASCASPEAFTTSGSSFEHITDPSSATQFGEISCESDQPNQLPIATLSVAAIRQFGEPTSLYGADSYLAYLSSGEQYDSKESSPSVGLSYEPKTDKKANIFEVSVEVHREQLLSSNSNNDEANSAEPESNLNDEANSAEPESNLNDDASSVEPESNLIDEIKRIVGSESHDDIPYMDDDPSSKSTCSTPLDEDSSKTED